MQASGGSGWFDFAKVSPEPAVTVVIPGVCFTNSSNLAPRWKWILFQIFDGEYLSSELHFTFFLSQTGEPAIAVDVSSHCYLFALDDSFTSVISVSDMDSTLLTLSCQDCDFHPSSWRLIDGIRPADSIIVTVPREVLPLIRALIFALSDGTNKALSRSRE
jgi:hypothetical protein